MKQNYFYLKEGSEFRVGNNEQGYVNQELKEQNERWAGCLFDEKHVSFNKCGCTEFDCHTQVATIEMHPRINIITDAVNLVGVSS